ncbi:NAD(P)-binding protein [Coniochaeta ligniaria NRRL 30616]|uniref:NAD(P)-binding protein n=1 Tax=Coniochaeta ligniaria NRRL 30616 TaxID=1408157 RepID=A0A1J7JH84_9PEZI|nr:NAD(P)-binding protein [Coniochaeta ligniaria NRRL 30616]
MSHQDTIQKIVLRASEVAKSPYGLAVLGVLASYSVLSRVNTYLSRRVVNNSCTDRTWDWKKEIVVITGGSSGIGASVVSKLEEKNIKVIILDRNKPPSQGPNTFFVECNLAELGAITTAAAHIRTKYGHPTVLINNAGFSNNKPLIDVTEQNLHSVFAVNVIAPILLSQEFLPAMIERNHGHIVNIASMASFSTQATNVDYGCTKAAVLSFHEGLLQELRHLYKAPAVRASIVHPSYVRTPLVADLLKKGNMESVTVEPEDVSGAVIRALYSGYGSQIVVPPHLTWVARLRSFPVWMQEKIRDGMSTMMIEAHSNMKNLKK